MGEALGRGYGLAAGPTAIRQARESLSNLDEIHSCPPVEVSSCLGEEYEREIVAQDPIDNTVKIHELA